MGYRLKGESFTIVDGIDAGKSYRRGQIYEAIPDGHERNFEEINQEEQIKINIEPSPAAKLPRTKTEPVTTGCIIKPKETEEVIEP